MAIYIDWATFIIHVPKSDLGLVQLTPTEVRELDINWFRLQLKNIEDNEDGSVFPKTHNHNPPVSVGGVTLARVVEILDPYTVTFEDGQYAVNLFGGNTNIGDKVNVNQVSVRSSNSAGLVNSAEIEYASFNGGVYIDQTNGVSGAIYPTGTPRQPVNNIADAKLIAERRGFDSFYVKGSLNLTTEDISGYSLYGDSVLKTNINISPSSTTVGCEIYDAMVSGYIDGGTKMEKCGLNNVTYVSGGVVDCLLMNNITMSGTNNLHLLNCVSGVPGTNPVVIDMGGNCGGLSVRNYSGTLELINKTGNSSVSLEVSQGEVILDSSVVNGEITCRGLGMLSNFASGNAVVREEMIDPVNLNMSLYDGAAVHIDTSSPYSGTLFPIGTTLKPVNNISDARIIADGLGIKKFYISGVIIIDQQYDDWMFCGTTSIFSDVVSFNNQMLNNCKFQQMSVTGIINGINQEYNTCYISNVTGIRGLTIDCALNGTITMHNNSTLINRNLSSMPSTTLNVNGGVGCIFQAALSPNSNFNVSGAQSGAIVQMTLNNMSKITLDNTNLIGSVFQFGGVGVVTNNSAGASVFDNTTKISSAQQVADEVRIELTPELTNLDELHKLSGLHPSHPLTVSSTGRTVGPITQTFTGDDPVIVQRT